MNELKVDVVIIGGGIAGICCAIEIMDNDIKNNTDTNILILDRDSENNFGGLAKHSFGGIFVCDTTEQKKNKISDSPELALKDWYSFGEFESYTGGNPDTVAENATKEEKWACLWAKNYVYNCKKDIYDWVKARGVKFLPLPLWVERGMHGGGESHPKGGGNTVPRWHIVWGTGKSLTEALIKTLQNHEKRKNLEIAFNYYVNGLVKDGDEVTGCKGTHNSNEFFVEAAHTVIASGGISGSMQMVRKYWPKSQGNPPKTILNGSHRYADGTLHIAVEDIGGNLTFLENMWNYAAGIHHWQPQKVNHGLSLVPCKSALWLNANGERIMPPLITGFDTRDLVTQISNQPEGYSWQILNQKIALKEFAISGAEFNEAFREKSYFKVLKNLALGNKKLVKDAVSKCADVVAADTLEQLVNKMNSLDPVNGETSKVDLTNLENAVKDYDAAIEAGEPYTDEQLLRIKKARDYKGDKLRTCNYQKIADKKAGSFIAIREFIVSRKSLGGIQTNMKAQVLTLEGGVIKGLFAIGESAGFGGGGMHGLRSLEGTFLGGCIYSGRIAGQAISGAKLSAQG